MQIQNQKKTKNAYFQFHADSDFFLDRKCPLCHYAFTSTFSWAAFHVVSQLCLQSEKLPWLQD